MVEMEEERLRMREHVMNEVRNLPLSFVLIFKPETLNHASLTSSVAGGFQQRQTRVFTRVPGCYK